MGEETAIEKSLVEQIRDAMFTIIEKREEFDTHSIQKLKQLTLSGNLTRTEQVIEAIKLTSEGHREST